MLLKITPIWPAMSAEKKAAQISLVQLLLLAYILCLKCIDAFKVKPGKIQKDWTRPLLYIWKSLIDDEWERKTIRRHVEKKMGACLDSPSPWDFC